MRKIFFILILGSICGNGSEPHWVDHANHFEGVSIEQRKDLIVKGKRLLSSIMRNEPLPETCLEVLSNYKDIQNAYYNKIPLFIRYEDPNTPPLPLALNSLTVEGSQNTGVLGHCWTSAISYLWPTAQEEIKDASIELENTFSNLSKGSEGRNFSLGGKKWASSYRRGRLEEICSLAWALYDMAYAKNEGFSRGAFIIEDPHSYLHDFLESYCIGVTNVESPAAIPSPFIQWVNFAYNRLEKKLSSHYKEERITHYGIDARFERSGFSLPVLPFQQKHILTGRVHLHDGKDYTFFKLEDEGLGDTRSIVRHTVNFVTSVSSIKMESVWRREKDIPYDIAEDIYLFFRHLYWEIKTLKRSLECYGDVYSKIEYFSNLANKERSCYCFTSSKFISLGQVLGYLDTLLSLRASTSTSLLSLRASTSTSLLSPRELTSTSSGMARNLYSKIEARYPKTAVLFRTGNEVILLREEF